MMNLRATLSWGKGYLPGSAKWALLWLSNPKSWAIGEWKLRSGRYPEEGPRQVGQLWRYWRVGPLELRRFGR